MTRVYWDTMLFVYWLEGNAEFGPRVREILAAMRLRGDGLCASALTVCELMVAPRRRGDEKAQRDLGALFRSPEIEVLPFSVDTAPRFAEIRARAAGTASAPAPTPAIDALHLAIAAGGGVNLFLTNDRQLQRLHVPGIDFIAGLDVPFY